MSVRSGSNWNLEVLAFKDRGNPEYPEKNLSEQLNELKSGGKEMLKNVIYFMFHFFFLLW